MAHRLSWCALLLTGAALAVVFTSCSVYMESTRPTPVDLDSFQIGQSRDSVLDRLGAPETTANETDGASCDFYKLYTKGYGTGGKIPIAIVEGAADAFTLGLAEVLLTPVEGVTKNEKHPVTFCYKGNGLARVTTDTGQVGLLRGEDTASSAIAPATRPSNLAGVADAAPSPGPSETPAVEASPSPVTGAAAAPSGPVAAAPSSAATPGQGSEQNPASGSAAAGPAQ